MAVNENEFFRDLTLKICSSLDLQTAFQRSFDASEELHTH